MTVGVAPSHPPNDDDSFHEPEFSQPTQNQLFPTPHDERQRNEPQASPELEDATLLVGGARDEDYFNPPEPKRRRTNDTEKDQDEVAATTPIVPDSPLVAPAIVEDDLMESDSEYLPPVTQANPRGRTEESSDELEKPLPSSAVGPRKQSSTSAAKQASDYEGGAEFSEPEKTPAKSGPQVVSDEDAPTNFSKFLDRNKVKGHKLERVAPPPKLIPKKAVPSPKKAPKSAPKAPPKAPPKKPKTVVVVERSSKRPRRRDPFEMESDVEAEADNADDDEPVASPEPRERSSRNKKKRKREPSSSESKSDSFVSQDEEESSEDEIASPTPDIVEEDEEEVNAPPRPKARKPAPQKVAKISALFAHMTFIITGIKHDSEITPDELKEQIKSFGGQIKNVRPDRSRRTHVGPVPSCVLISDNPQRTFKYIMALACNVPLLHYKWVIDCCHAGSLIDPRSDVEKYVLPAGTSYTGEILRLYVSSNMLLVFCLTQSFSPDWFFEEDPVGSELVAPEEYAVFWVDRDGVPDEARIDVVGVKAFQDQWRSIVRAAGAKAPDPDRLTDKKATTDFALRYALHCDVFGFVVVVD